MEFRLLFPMLLLSSLTVYTRNVHTFSCSPFAFGFLLFIVESKSRMIISQGVLWRRSFQTASRGRTGGAGWRVLWRQDYGGGKDQWLQRSWGRKKRSSRRNPVLFSVCQYLHRSEGHWGYPSLFFCPDFSVHLCPTVSLLPFPVLPTLALVNLNGWEVGFDFLGSHSSPTFACLPNYSPTWLEFTAGMTNIMPWSLWQVRLVSIGDLSCSCYLCICKCCSYTKWWWCSKSSCGICFMSHWVRAW